MSNVDHRSMSSTSELIEPAPLPDPPSHRSVTRSSTPASIPYAAVFGASRGHWLPGGVPIGARITRIRRAGRQGSTLHCMSAHYHYTIELEHGHFRWRVERSYGDFAQLHNRLGVHRAAEMVRRPMQRAQERVDEALEHALSSLMTPGPSQKSPPTIYPWTPVEEEHAGNDGEQLARQDRKADEKKSRKLAKAAAAAKKKKGFQRLQNETPYLVTPAPCPTAANDDDVKKSQEKKSPKDRFPMMPEPMVPNQKTRKTQLERWLQQLLQDPSLRDRHETAEFLDVSRLSFIRELGNKRREAMVSKRPGGSRSYMGLRKFCVAKCMPWNRRWLVVKDTFVCYLDPGNERIRRVLLVDGTFGVVPASGKLDRLNLSSARLERPRDAAAMTGGSGNRTTATVSDISLSSPGRPTDDGCDSLVIFNQQHKLHVRCRNSSEAAKLCEAIKDIMLESPGAAYRSTHKFGSAFPVRERTFAQWFVDGESFMLRAAYLLECAKDEIFITRPAVEGTQWRLDEILKRRAEAGVQIFILLYKEMEMALGLNSVYTKRTLKELHPNIKVMRHPDHYPGTGTFFWAHHEKLIVIDQLVAFVGGIDLCYGRWDNAEHRLVDMGSVQLRPPPTVTNSETDLATRERSSPKATRVTFNDHPDVVVLPSSLSDSQIDAFATALDDDSNVFITAPPPTTATVRHGSSTLTPVSILSARSSNSSSNGVRSPSVDLTPAMALLRTAEQQERLVDRATVYRDTTTADVDEDERKRTTTARKWNEIINAARRSKSESAKGHHPAGTTESSISTATAKSSRKDWRRTSVAVVTPSTKIIATPPSAIISQAAGQGADLNRIARMYKDYVESGAAEKEKRMLASAVSKKKTPSAGQDDTSLGPDQYEGGGATVATKWFIRRFVNEWRAKSLQRRIAKNETSDSAAYELVLLRVRAAAEEAERAAGEADGGRKLWIGKDYVNFIHKDFVELDAPFSDFIDRSVTPRMPWHDIHSVVYGEAARDVARHFIQRWNATKDEKRRESDSLPYLLPRSTAQTPEIPAALREGAHLVSAQVVRSLSNWSARIDSKEDSIQQAYCQLIANARHYVYIENQFFVSMIGSADVQNSICQAIYDRVVRAHRKGERLFRVFILVPLLPGFEGDVGTPGGSSLQAVLHWTYQSLSRGEHSLFGRLRAAGVPAPDHYIAVNSLRTFDRLGARLVSELIYVHCKLAIVDDEHVIIGSANINDRSQQGDRDSEVLFTVEMDDPLCQVCVVYTDVEFENSRLAERPYQAGKFAKSLRIQCMKEHLGLLDDSTCCHRLQTGWGGDAAQNALSLDDPCSASFYDHIWRDVARSNTQIYEDVFRAYPTDRVETFEQLARWSQQPSMAECAPDAAEHRLRLLRGSLVEFPLNFLAQAKLTPAITCKEGLVPTSVFT